MCYTRLLDELEEGFKTSILTRSILIMLLLFSWVYVATMIWLVVIGPIHPTLLIFTGVAGALFLLTSMILLGFVWRYCASPQPKPSNAGPIWGATAPTHDEFHHRNPIRPIS